jgi:ABC-type Zn uptake system ZnuABC Zn-binding protein ZnuA
MAPQDAEGDEVAAVAPGVADQDDDDDHFDEVSAELEPVALAAGERLRVVATTNIVGDIVSQVGGERIELRVLLPIGADPHAFNPAPQDVAAIYDAHVLFANGAGLEEFMQSILETAPDTPIVYLSEGIELREWDDDHDDDGADDDDDHDVDPHTWVTPHNALVFVHNVEHALSALDPDHAEYYHENAEAYEETLEELDAWVQAQIDTIPVANRKLVADHSVFGYYADRYGLEELGAVIPSFSTVSEPSARELAALQDTVREHEVPAIFVGTTVSPTVVDRLAEDLGIRVVALYTGSLGPAGSGAETYVDYVRYNTNAIVEALR